MSESTPAQADPTEGQQGLPQYAEKPEGLEDRFWNAETRTVDLPGLQKSYSELRSKMSVEGAPKQPVDSLVTPEATEAPDAPAVTAGPESEASTEETTEAQETPAEETSPPSLYDQAASEFTETGDVSQETREALMNAGVPEALIESHINLAKSAEAQNQQAVYESAGVTEQDYQIAAEWAGQNMTEDEIAEYNKLANDPNLTVRSLALKDLIARHKQAEGVPPASTVRGESAASTVPGYESRSDLMKDMQSVQYSQDPTFRARVQSRLRASHSSITNPYG